MSTSRVSTDKDPNSRHLLSPSQVLARHRAEFEIAKRSPRGERKMQTSGGSVEICSGDGCEVRRLVCCVVCMLPLFFILLPLSLLWWLTVYDFHSILFFNIFSSSLLLYIYGTDYELGTYCCSLYLWLDRTITSHSSYPYSFLCLLLFLTPECCPKQGGYPKLYAYLGRKYCK